jgi:hypothetical protein
LGDKGYHGYDQTGHHVITPYKGRNKPESQKEANRAHARLRGPGERANAQLKCWRILRKLRCCPRRAGRLAKAIHVLQKLRSRRRMKNAQYVAARYPYGATYIPLHERASVVKRLGSAESQTGGRVQIES